MEAHNKEELKSKIIELIKKSEQDLIEIRKMTEPVVPENSLGRISRMDAINNKSVMELAQRNKEAKLSKLQRALSNIRSMILTLENALTVAKAYNQNA